MKNLSKVLIAFLVVLSAVLAQGNKEFRATWVITWEYQADSTLIKEILDNHVTANMNAVLFQVRQGGTAYYRSSFEPWGPYADYKDPGFDPLEFAVKEAHKRGLELHAWFNTFQTSSTAAGTPAGDHPEWVCRDGYDNPMPASRALSPGLPEVREYTRNVIMEIVNNYDVDGLHLDYVRWNEYTTSTVLSKSTMAEERMLDGQITETQMAFLESTASADRYLYDKDHKYSDGIPAGYGSWEEFWRSSVTTLVHSVHDSIQAVKPWVRLSVAALGKYRWSGWQGYESVYQDAALWYNENYIDQLTPMHYHWTTGSGFYDMLAGNGTDNWGYWLDDDSEVLFSVGPGSYILDDNNIWKNHAQIIDYSRRVDFVDGFQFFSYGSWDGRMYWEEAGATFFGQKTKIRSNHNFSGTEPNAPELTLAKNGGMEYSLTVTPDPAETDANWYAIYRSENSTIDLDSSEIIAIKMTNQPFTITDEFDGNQNFSGEYTYAATALNRFWVESNVSNLQVSDMITSNPPVVLGVTPTEGDSIPTNPSIVIEFSKEIDETTIENAVTISPEATLASFTLSSNWDDDNKVLTLRYSGLENATNYTITINENLKDLTGNAIDGNYDGIGGDAYTVTFPTYNVDLRGPIIESSYPYTGLSAVDPEDVFNILFDELIDEESAVANIKLINDGKEISTGIQLTTEGTQSLVSIKPKSQLMSGAELSIQVNEALTDTAGNPMGETVEYSSFVGDYYYSENILGDNFTGTTEWWDPEGSGSTVGTVDAFTTFAFAKLVYVPGYGNTKSGRLNYQWDEGYTNQPLLRAHASSGPGVNLQVDTTYTVQCYVYGDGSNNKIRISFYERNGNSIGEATSWKTIDWIGWKLVEWDLNNPEDIGLWEGVGNQVMDGEYYNLDGIHMTRGDDGAVSGTVYVDELRIVKKSTGDQPANSAPVVEDIEDISIDQGGYKIVNVNYTDADAVDTHEIICLADTVAVRFNIKGHTSGSQVIIAPDDDYYGEAVVSIIVKDFGIGELADTTTFILNVGQTDVDDEIVATEYALSQNYPNPFNPETNIRFSVPELKKVEINVYDMRGNLVKQLVNDVYSAGTYTVNFYAGNIASGVYIYQMKAGNKVMTKKMMLVK